MSRDAVWLYQNDAEFHYMVSLVRFSIRSGNSSASEWRDAIALAEKLLERESAVSKPLANEEGPTQDSPESGPLAGRAGEI